MNLGQTLKVRGLKDIIGGSPNHNKAALFSLLDGEQSAYRDSVLLNSAAALIISGKATTLVQGIAIAANSNIRLLLIIFFSYRRLDILPNVKPGFIVTVEYSFRLF